MFQLIDEAYIYVGLFANLTVANNSNERLIFRIYHLQYRVMSITYMLNQWLEDSGYEYHCFISWPHTKSRELTQCARKVKEAIEESLALSIARPKVFWDESEIYGGANWQETLLRSLCKSVAMVSICAPIYYDPSHPWCGLEWAAMHGLSRKRIPRAGFNTIIPILVKEDDAMPKTISQIQCINISGLMASSRQYHLTNEFRHKIAQIVAHIERIAQTLQHNNSITNCEQVKIPPKSAFAKHRVKANPFPFRDN